MSLEFSINLENPPVSTNEYLSSDYIELLCLTSVDGILSKEQVAARIFKLDDIDADAEALEEEAIQEEDELLHVDNEADYLPEPKHRLSERKAMQADDWFSQLEFRAGVYGDFYPFNLSNDKDSLSRTEEISLKNKLYIYLLLASNLRYFPKREQTRLANYFEIASVEALKQYLSPVSEVYLFGNNPLNRGRYSGSLWERIMRFSGDIGDKPRREQKYYPSKNRGERGLDVVGWLPLPDKREGILVVTGQCACGEEKDWEDKQLTSHRVRWESHINFTAKPINSIFIPHSFRSSDGEWFNVTRINDSILFDRLRLIHLLDDVCDTLGDKLPYDIVDQVLKFEESLV